MFSPPNSVAEDVMFLSCPFVCQFVWTDFVTTSYEWLEQSR